MDYNAIGPSGSESFQGMLSDLFNCGDSVSQIFTAMMASDQWPLSQHTAHTQKTTIITFAYFDTNILDARATVRSLSDRGGRLWPPPLPCRADGERTLPRERTPSNS